MRYKKVLSVTLCLLLFVFLTESITACNVTSKHKSVQAQKQGEALFLDMQSALSDYPNPPDRFGYTSFYYCDGKTEYLLVASGIHQLTAKRPLNEDPVYYIDGNTWSLDDTGTPISLGVRDSSVEDIATTTTKTLLADGSFQYTYHVAKGRDLPLWVYPNEHYLYCRRAEFSNHVEVMVMEEAYLRWNIAKSSDDVVLFLFASDTIRTEADKKHNIAGWGQIPDSIYNLAFGA